MIVLAFMMATSVPTAPSPIETIVFKNTDVLVVDADGQPLFRSAGDYLLKTARNPAGKVIRYDPVGKRVLVSEAGPEYWVRCADLTPMQISCPAAPPRPATRSIRIPRTGADGGSTHPGILGRGLPACPGDPRCPKSD